MSDKKFLNGKENPYFARIQQDPDGGVVAFVAGIEQGVTQADTVQELAEMAEDMLISVLTFFTDDGVEIPLEFPFTKETGFIYLPVRLDAWTTMQINVYNVFVRKHSAEERRDALVDYAGQLDVSVQTLEMIMNLLISSKTVPAATFDTAIRFLGLMNVEVAQALEANPFES